jgi:hypothetical protein
MLCIFRVLKEYHALDFIITNVTTEISNAKLELWLSFHYHKNTYHVVLIF